MWQRIWPTDSKQLTSPQPLAPNISRFKHKEPTLLTRLGKYADKALEAGWLAVAIFIPMFFNVYSSRVFEPDKIALMRSLVLLMTLAWVVKLAEGGWRAMRETKATTPTEKAYAV